MVRQGNGNGERIKTPLELEKEELRRLIRDFHPDKFMDASADDQKRSKSMVQMLNALGEIHENKKLISENGWPKGTTPPKEIPLVAIVNGRRIGVNFGYGNTPATPQQYFDEVREFHRDPSAYHARVVAENQAEHDRRESERMRRAAAEQREQERRAEIERVAREAHARAEQERAQREAEIKTITKRIEERFGITAEIPRLQELDRVFRGQKNESTVADMKKAEDVLEKVGAGISMFRGFKVTVSYFGQTNVNESTKTITIMMHETTDAAFGLS